MSVEQVRARLASIDELPALPTIVVEINNLLSDPKTTAPALAKVIMRDPAITARVLKIVNSAFFGFPKRIESVNQAIIALGFNTVRSIVLCSSVMEAFSSARTKNDALVRKDFWAFSVGVASGARVVARNAGEKKTETAFVCGLLHGVGKLVLDQFFHEPFVKALKDARENNRTLFESERQILGATHADVGGVLLEMWKMSEVMHATVAHQEDPMGAPEEHRAAVAHVVVANALARILAIGDPGDIVLPRISPDIMSLCAIEEAAWPRLIELTVDEAKKASIFADLN